MITRVDFSDAGKYRARVSKMSPVNQRAEAALYQRWLRDKGLGLRRRQIYQMRLGVLRVLLGESDG